LLGNAAGCCSGYASGHSIKCFPTAALPTGRLFLYRLLGIAPKERIDRRKKQCYNPTNALASDYRPLTMDYPHTIVPGVLGAAQQYPVTITHLQVNHVYALALQHARTYALGYNFAEDVSQSFGTRWLSDLRENKVWAKRCLDSEAYLRACAQNYAKHEISAIQQRSHRETAFPESLEDGGVACAESRDRFRHRFADPAIRNEFCVLLTEVISRLQPRPREIFIRRHINQEAVASIAAALGCTPNAVSSSLSGSRNRIAAHLIAAGQSESDIREYLYEMLKPE